MYFNGNELPKPTGQIMFLEFKPSYEYCLLPSYWDQGRLMTYQRKPEFVNLFKSCCEISRVIIFCQIVHIVILYVLFLQWGYKDSESMEKKEEKCCMEANDAVGNTDIGEKHCIENTEIAEKHDVENKDEIIHKQADLVSDLKIKVGKCKIANEHQKEKGFCMGANDPVGNTEIAEKQDIENKYETINKQADWKTGLNVQVGKCEIKKVEKSIPEERSKMGFRQNKKRDDKADNTEVTNLPKCIEIRVRRCPHILPLDLGKVLVAPNINPDVGRIVYSVRKKNKKYLR